MLGYLYQCRYALLAGLRASKSKPSMILSIERFDDIAFEAGADLKQAIQLKHHGKAGDLTDASVDLWKTIGIWAGKCAANPQLPFEVQFLILTTGAAPEGSAAALLRPGRAPTEADKACTLLVAVATKSTNAITGSARKAFLALQPEIRKSLCDAIQIFDNAPSITNAREELEEIVAFAATAENVATFVDYLEGWWFAEVVRMLSAPNEPGIAVTAMRTKIDELREAFKSGQLPMTEASAEATADEVADADSRIFVRQIRAVGVSDPLVKIAVRDYYRASAQRSRWARENLLLDGEAALYDRELVDRWNRQFEANKEGLDTASETAKAECGRKNFYWANQLQVSFRNRSEIWLTTGSYQMLADRVQVGWHPDFTDKFQSGEG